MDDKLNLVRIDSVYCDYLREYDNKVPYNFEKKELRPFIGVLFSINECKYFAPLSSPKAKHMKMKNTIDFFKLDNGKLGAINFNNMLPVKDNNIIVLDLNVICFNNKEKQYQKLLKEQIYWLNRHSNKIYKSSKRLYDAYITGNLNEKIIARCCNFPLLEEKCNEYNLLQISLPLEK